MSGVGNGEGAFFLAEGAAGATTYYTPSDAGDAMFSFIQSQGRLALSAQFVLSVWPGEPVPGGGAAPGWLIEYRVRGVFAGYICDGRTSGPHTFPRGRQERLSGTNDWENLTKRFGEWVRSSPGSADPDAPVCERQGRDSK